MISSPEGYAVAAVSIAVFVFVLRWTSRHQRLFLAETERLLTDARDQNAKQDEAIEALKRESWVCMRRQDLLLKALRDIGGDVPRAFWDDPVSPTG